MRRTLKSSLDIANRIMNNKIGYNMSAFKNKLAKIQQNNYLSISNFYDDLMLF
jgi:hypothetical protein